MPRPVGIRPFGLPTGRARTRGFGPPVVVGAVLLLTVLSAFAVGVHSASAAPVGSSHRASSASDTAAPSPRALSKDRPAAVPIPQSVRPSSVVNPRRDHAAEPSPMGLADFGVTASGTGYAYSTSAFLGTISIQALTAHYKFSSGGTNYYGTEISLQLNAELVLSHPGKANITYWVQDVVVIETSTNEIAFNNNIWNVSAGGDPEARHPRGERVDPE